MPDSDAYQESHFMPVTPTYPGVYIEEIPSGVRTITPVSTSITAFVGSAPRGRARFPVLVQSYADYTRKFGGLEATSAMSYAVSHFFQNGGSDALIIRVVHTDAISAKVNVGGLPLAVASEGIWGNQIRARVDLETKDKLDQNATRFNLFVYDSASKALEAFRNL